MLRELVESRENLWWQKVVDSIEVLVVGHNQSQDVLEQLDYPCYVLN